MDKELTNLVLNVICERWKRGERTIASEDIYAQLIDAGVHVPEGAMAELFDTLEKHKGIKAAFPTNADATRIHGSAIITGVSDWLC